MRPVTLALTILAAVLFVACAEPEPPTTTSAMPAVDASAERAAIGALGDRYVQLFNGKDAAGLAGMYTADAVRIVSGQEPNRGEDAIRAAIQQGFDAGSVALTIQPEETIVADDGKTAVSYGGYQVDVAPPKAKPMKAMGTYMNLLMKEPDGTWKVSRSLVAPAPPSPPAS